MGPFATSLAVLLAGASTASGTVFSLKETYDVSNFFNKFDIFESKFGTTNPNDHDPSKGFVNYKNRDDAFDSGLVKYEGNDVYIGVDSENKWWSPDGRPSIRLESKKDYTKGLFIARFSHLPKRACGAWPAFWTYSQVGTWPNGGEVDIYENWNLATQNHPTFHTGDVDVVGRCVINTAGSTGSLLRPDCSHDNTNTGCNVADTNGPWATSDGGIYAMEWTDSYIRVFTWSHADAPSNIDSKHPDTAAWGKPVIEVHDGPCNIKRQFGPQKLVLNIDFCGDAAGNEYLWNQECGIKTGEKECYQYVRNHPEEYKDVYFKVKDIRYFEEGYIADPTSSSTTTTSTSTTTSSTSTSSSTTTSIMTSTTSSTTSSSTPTSTSTSLPTSFTPTSTISSSSSTSSSSTSSSSTSSSSTSSSSTSSSSTDSSSSSSSSSAPISSNTSSNSSSQTSSSSVSSATSSTTTTSSSTDAGSSSSSAVTTSSATSKSSATTSSSASPTSSSDSSSSSSVSATTSLRSSLTTSSSQVSPSSSATDSSSPSATSSVTVSSSSVSTSSSSDLSASSTSAIPTSSSIQSDSSSSTPITTDSSAQSTGTATSSALPGTTDSSSSTSTLAATTTTSSQEEWTTSVVYTTTTYTITSCAPTVTNCPGKGHVVTETIPLYTTVCPVTPTPTAAPSPSSSAPPPPGQQPKTITTKVTKVYTIISCAPTVTNCPVGKVTTEVVTSTVCPGCSKDTSKPSSSSVGTGCSGGNCATGVPTMIESASVTVTSAVPRASSSAQQLSSSGVSTGASSVVTSASSHVAAASSHVASSGTVPSSTQQPTGTQTRIPTTGLANPGKSVSRAVALVAGVAVAALFL